MTRRAYELEVELIRQHGGGLRMAEALRLGINRKALRHAERWRRRGRLALEATFVAGVEAKAALRE